MDLVKLTLLFLAVLGTGSQSSAMEDQSSYDSVVIAEIESQASRANIHNGGGITPLMYSVIMPEYRSYSKVFLEKNPESEIAHVYTALMFAISFNLEDHVLMLVDYVAHKLKQTKIRDIILECARHSKNARITEIVLSRLGSGNQEVGLNDFVRQSTHDASESYVETVRRVIEEPATTDDDVELGDSHLTSNEIAAIQWPLEIRASIMRETNAINREPGFSITPLMTTILLAPFHDYAPLFLDKDINAQAEDGSTALMLAVNANLSNIVKLLLLHNADIDLENKDGKTALAIAYDRNLIEMIGILLENGTSRAVNNQESASENPMLTTEEVAQEARLYKPTNGQVSPMEIDQAAAEHELVTEYDSDREFTVRGDFFEEERHVPSEVDYSSDEDFTVNMASFELENLEQESVKSAASTEKQTELKAPVKRFSKIDIEAYSKPDYRMHYIQWHETCHCDFPGCSYIAIDRSALSKHKQDHAKAGSSYQRK